MTRVLLVDHDVDTLVELAGSLREHGLRVSLANGVEMALSRAKASVFDAVLTTFEVASTSPSGTSFGDAFGAALAAPPPVIVLVDEVGVDEGARVSRGDVAAIVTRLASLRTEREEPPRTTLAPSSYTLTSTSTLELLAVLAAEGRAGALTVTSPQGSSGEIRIFGGELFDAVFGRLECEKALARMAQLRDGDATFAPSESAIMRRLRANSRALIEEARAAAERATRAFEHAGSLTTATLIAADGATNDVSSSIENDVLARLRVPAKMSELLDELPSPDADILGAVSALAEQGKIKELGHTARVQLCGPDQIHLVRASAERAKLAGFAGPARLVFAATTGKIAVLAHTVLSLADARIAADPAPSLPLPHSLATLVLGDGAELDVVALPLVPVYAPTWPMALAGAAVVVRLDEAATDTLEEACTSVGVTILDARAVFGVVLESSGVQIASLIRTALDTETRR